MPSTTLMNWEYWPAAGGHPAAYRNDSRNMLVIQRGARAWNVYQLAAGVIVENVFTTPGDAISWCDGKAH